MKQRAAPKDRSTPRAKTVHNPRDIAARIQWAVEAGEAEDFGAALDVLRDLLDELAPTDPRSSCPACGLAMWPGQIPRHVSVVHGVDPYAKAA